MTESNEVADELEEGLKKYRIPSYMERALRAYVIHHKEPGKFLQAVIQNNLCEAVNRADEKNMFIIRGWVGIFYNFTPSLCHGSVEKYREWVKMGRGVDWSKIPERMDPSEIPLFRQHAEEDF